MREDLTVERTSRFVSSEWKAKRQVLQQVLREFSDHLPIHIKRVSYWQKCYGVYQFTYLITLRKNEKLTDEEKKTILKHLSEYKITVIE